MATNRKAWFKVADSIGRDDLSNDELATLIRLMGALNTQWARDGLTAEESTSIVLRPVDLMALTGSRSLVRARRTIVHMRANVSLTVEEQGANTRIKWPKWASFQGLTTRKQGKPDPEIAPRLPPPQKQTQTLEADAVREEKRDGKPPSAVALPFGEEITDDEWVPLANVLSKLDGDRDEKLAWLAENFALLQADTESHPKGHTIRSLAIRYYRAYLGGKREFKNSAARQETRRKLAELEAEYGADMTEIEETEGYAAAHR